MPKLGTLNDLKTLNLETALIVSPSDTTYGFHSRSLRQMQEIKKRTGNFIYLVNSVEMAETLTDIAPDKKKILKKYWPGPITFVFRAKHASNETIAIRWPKDPFCADLVKAFNGPVLSTSCNNPGEPPIQSIDEAIALFGDKISLYIDGGKRAGIRPSTLVDLTLTPPVVLRQGDTVFTPMENNL